MIFRRRFDPASNCACSDAADAAEVAIRARDRQVWKPVARSAALRPVEPARDLFGEAIRLRPIIRE